MGVLLVISAPMLETSLISIHGAGILDRPRSDDSVKKKKKVERDDARPTAFRWGLNDAVI